MTSEPMSSMLEPAERRQILSNQLTSAVAQGYRVETQTDSMAVLVKGKRVNHILHFLLGFPTLGMWWVVWIFLAITGGEKRSQLQVDAYGSVLFQKLG